MVITKMALPRRTFLRGIGATLALPLLDAMIPALKAAPKGVPRLGFFQTPNGMSMKYWTPAKIGANFEFTEPLKPLEPFRERVMVLSGLNHYCAGLGDGGGPHTRGYAAWLSGMLAQRTEVHPMLGTTADQFAARELGKDTMIESLELSLQTSTIQSGACENGYSCLYQLLSWRSATEANPTEGDPRVVFERMFGEETSNEDRLARIRADKSILDAVVGQINAMQRRLGGSDRLRVSEYLETVRDVEKRIQMAEQQNANSTFSPGERPTGIPEKWQEHRELMFDLLVLAYQADITRVATFDMGGSNYSFVGVPEAHHDLSHHGGNAEKREKLAKIDTYNVSTFAKFVEKLSKIQDGDGSLLDRSIMLFGSSLSDGDMHSPLDLPTVIAGGGNGTLKGNQHLRWAEDKKVPMANLYTTLLDKIGVHIDKIGDSSGELVEL
jgi:Protein of unknown function (DUF1552)